jgi:signal transduction histidine kinase/CheY-like chemotaxis protein
MADRVNSISLRLTLFAVSVFIALATLVLLGFEWTQRQALQAQGSQRVDSVTAPAFLLDREYLRFVNHLDLFLNARTPPSLDDVRIRLDILLSKVETVRESPGSALLLGNARVAQSVDQMVAFASRAELALSGGKPDVPRLRIVLAEMQAFTAESLALGNAADLLGSKLLERQTHDLLFQNSQITWLTLAQLLLLSLVASGLVWRHRVQQREEKALKALNEELRQAQQDADSANVGKSLFLANMSHELRTPFNGVMGLLSLLAKTPLNAEQAEWVKIANDSAGHLLLLLNDILDMSALESGNISLRLQPVHVPEFLRGIEAMFQPLALQKNLRFEMHNEMRNEGQGDVWLESDSTRQRQILFNLITNAIKFTEQGQVTLTVRAVRDAQDTPWLEMAVQDTGIGMDEAALGQLFQRFFQADASLSRKFAGAGLGLQISRSLAQRLGGDITVQSQLGIGSVFTVRLPWVVLPAPVEPVAHGVPAVESARPHRSARILVAEDHPVNRKFMSILLERLGYETTFCENGELAVAALRSADYDLVLMDIHMPVMDGLTATRQIRAMAPHMLRIPIIALTADVLQEARDQAQAAGVDGFLAKPVKQEDLAPLIAQMLARQAYQ